MLPPYPGDVIALQQEGATKIEEQSLIVGGQNNSLRIIYGRTVVGADIAGITREDSAIVLLCVWGEGPCDAIERYWIDGADPGAGTTATHYLGTLDQVPDLTLQRCFSKLHLPPYNDPLRGICYSVFKVTPAASAGFPQFTALIRGKKVSTSSGGAKTYSNNPAYCIADFIEDSTYGMNRTVNWTEVAAVASHCDEMIGTQAEKRHIFSLVVDQPQTVDSWLSIMCDYAGCWVLPEGQTYRLILDAPGSSVFSFDSSNIVAGTFTAQKNGPMDAPTVVEVDYTDTSAFPWRTDTTDPVYVQGVYDNPPTVPFRRTRVSKPGLQRKSEATRYAIELLNGAYLNDLSVQFTAFDVAIKLEVGDLVQVTHPLGLVAKLMRIVQLEPIAPGRWAVSATEHDDAKYSTEVVTNPTSVDTPLPSPLTPPTVTGLAVTEDVYQVATGLFGSRLAISWDSAATDYPFVWAYVVTVKEGAVVKDRAVVHDTSHLTKNLTENILYTVTVAVVSTLNIQGTEASTTFTNNGKAARPGDMTILDGYEVGGEVRLQWELATDLDITGTELRYGSTSSSWGTATLLDRVAAPGVRYTTKVIPAGDWRFFAKGLDSVRSPDWPYGQESVNAIYKDITVTSDDKAFLAAEHTFTTATLTHMSEIRDGNGTVYWVSDDGTVADSVFTANPLGSSYPNVLATYPGGYTSTLETDHHDVGALISGTWVASLAYEDLSGAATPYLDLSATDSGYTGYGTMSSSETMRWTKLRVTSTGALLVTSLGNVRVTTVGRSESGVVATLSTGPKTVNLTNKYLAAISIQITPSGATPYVMTYDNVVVGSGANSFDVYAFNLAGVKQVASATYLFTGV